MEPELKAMVVRAADMQIVEKPRPQSREEARAKADFDQSMVMIRHQVEFADTRAAEYFFREMMRECRTLSRRFGLKIG